MSIRTNLFAVAVLTVVLTGCSTARLTNPDVRLPKGFEADRASQSQLPPQTLDRWWTLFADAQLSTVVEEALVASPDAQSAFQRILEARSTRAQTLAAYLPQGNLTGLAQNQHTSESFGGAGVESGVGTGAGIGTGGGTSSIGSGSGASNGSSASDFLTPTGDLQSYGAQFNVTYELDLFGRHKAARRGADADVAAARFDYEATRSSLATNVASNLFQARGYAIQLADAQETLRIARDLARAAELSSSHGLTATSDTARLESDVATDQSEVARLEAQALASRRSLLALIGRGAAPLDTLKVYAVTAPPPFPPATTPGELLHRRPDVREAEAQLRSAAANLTLDKLALFPDFQLAPGAQVSKTTGSYDSLTTVWTIGLNAAMPILDRPRLLAVIRGQRARGEAAVAAYERTVQNAYRDAENGLTALASDRRRVQNLEIAVTRSRFAFDAKRRGYDLGLSDLTTLLDAERTWRLAKSTLATAETTGLVDAATLFQALGGGWSPDADDAARGGSQVKVATR